MIRILKWLGGLVLLILASALLFGSLTMPLGLLHSLGNLLSNRHEDGLSYTLGLLLGNLVPLIIVWLLAHWSIQLFKGSRNNLNISDEFEPIDKNLL